MTKMTSMKGSMPLCTVLAALVAVACLGFVPSAEALLDPRPSVVIDNVFDAVFDAVFDVVIDSVFDAVPSANTPRFPIDSRPSWMVTSDADVNALASEIDAGGVLVGYKGVEISGNVTDLSPLSVLKRVKNGSLAIEDTTALTDLTGLENLETVDWGVYLRDNEKLESIALDSLGNVSSSLEIKGNEKLASVSLPELSSVGYGVFIADNPLLSALSLDVSSVGESVTIEGNGLETLGETVHFGSVEGSFIVNEENLASMDGFAVDSVNMLLMLKGGPKLTSLEGMQVGSVGWSFLILGEALSADSVPTDLVGIADMGVTVNGESL